MHKYLDQVIEVDEPEIELTDFKKEEFSSQIFDESLKRRKSL